MGELSSLEQTGLMRTNILSLEWGTLCSQCVEFAGKIFVQGSFKLLDGINMIMTNIQKVLLD